MPDQSHDGGDYRLGGDPSWETTATQHTGYELFWCPEEPGAKPGTVKISREEYDRLSVEPEAFQEIRAGKPLLSKRLYAGDVIEVIESCLGSRATRVWSEGHRSVHFVLYDAFVASASADEYGDGNCWGFSINIGGRSHVQPFGRRMSLREGRGQFGEVLRALDEYARLRLGEKFLELFEAMDAEGMLANARHRSRLTLGPKITPGPDTRVRDLDNIPGEGWYAKRTAGGCVLSWDCGGIATDDAVVAITRREFERLRTEPESFDELARKYDPNNQAAPNGSKGARDYLRMVVARDGLTPVAFLDEEGTRENAVTLEPDGDGWKVHITGERGWPDPGAKGWTFATEAAALDFMLEESRQLADLKQRARDRRAARDAAEEAPDAAGLIAIAEGVLRSCITQQWVDDADGSVWFVLCDIFVAHAVLHSTGWSVAVVLGDGTELTDPLGRRLVELCTEKQINAAMEVLKLNTLPQLNTAYLHAFNKSRGFHFWVGGHIGTALGTGLRMSRKLRGSNR